MQQEEHAVLTGGGGGGVLGRRPRTLLHKMEHDFSSDFTKSRDCDLPMTGVSATSLYFF